MVYGYIRVSSDKQGIRAKPICQILKVLSDGAKVMIYSHTDKKRK